MSKRTFHFRREGEQAFGYAQAVSAGGLLFVSGTMYLVMRRHAANQREHDSLALIGEHKH